MMVSIALVEVSDEEIWVVPPLAKVMLSPPVVPMVKLPAPPVKVMLRAFWFARALATVSVKPGPPPLLNCTVDVLVGTPVLQLDAVFQSDPLDPCHVSVCAWALPPAKMIPVKTIPERRVRLTQEQTVDRNVIVFILRIVFNSDFKRYFPQYLNEMYQRQTNLQGLLLTFFNELD